MKTVNSALALIGQRHGKHVTEYTLFKNNFIRTRLKFSQIFRCKCNCKFLLKAHILSSHVAFRCEQRRK